MLRFVALLKEEDKELLFLTENNEQNYRTFVENIGTDKLSLNPIGNKMLVIYGTDAANPNRPQHKRIYHMPTHQGVESFQTYGNIILTGLMETLPDGSERFGGLAQWQLNAIQGITYEVIEKNNWKELKLEITYYHDVHLVPLKQLGLNFYISAYACPRPGCNSVLYKTVFPLGEEYPINTSSGPRNLKRVFTCISCATFFAPVPGRRLNEGYAYSMQYEDIQEYLEELKKMDIAGTTVGRMDL